MVSAAATTAAAAASPPTSNSKRSSAPAATAAAPKAMTTVQPEVKSVKARNSRCAQAVGRRLLQPLLDDIERHLHIAFEGEISPARLTEALYTIGTPIAKQKPRRVTAYLLFHRDVRRDVLDEMTTRNGGPVAQREVYAELGNRWKIAKGNGLAEKYFQMERDLAAETAAKITEEEHKVRAASAGPKRRRQEAVPNDDEEGAEEEEDDEDEEDDELPPPPPKKKATPKPVEQSTKVVGKPKAAAPVEAKNGPPKPVATAAVVPRAGAKPTAGGTAAPGTRPPAVARAQTTAKQVLQHSTGKPQKKAPPPVEDEYEDDEEEDDEDENTPSF